MNLLSILKQEALGILNLSLPISALIFLSSQFEFSNSIILICSFLFGLYLFFLNYKSAQSQIKQLKFEPCDENKKELAKIVEQVGMNLSQVNIRYSYTTEMICATTFNTISIDPLYCNSLENDSNFQEAKNLIEKYILPQLDLNFKARIEKIKEALTIPAQNFIIRHELGHVYYNYSIKKLLIVSLIGSVAMFMGFKAAIWANSVLGYFSNFYLHIIFGLVVAAIIDIILSYSSNLFFKLNEENRADLFAVKYSTFEEINQAANFFEKFSEITAKNEITGIISFLPTTILTGYNEGKVRAQILREMALNKKLA